MIIRESCVFEGMNEIPYRAILVQKFTSNLPYIHNKYRIVKVWHETLYYETGDVVEKFYPLVCSCHELSQYHSGISHVCL